MNMEIIKGVGKCILGTGAVGAGAIVIADGVGDIRSAVKAGKMYAESADAADACEDVSLDDEDDAEATTPETEEVEAE